MRMCVFAGMRIYTRAVSVAPLAQSYLHGDLPRGLPRHSVAPVVQGHVSAMMASTDIASRQLISKSERALSSVRWEKSARTRVYEYARFHTVPES